MRRNCADQQISKLAFIGKTTGCTLSGKIKKAGINSTSSLFGLKRDI
jgi:hypothetical protein